jgi:integrase/recombinase XerD
MKKLLNYMRTDSSKEEIVRMRDYAMWLVLTYWWLRVSELVSLKVQDVRENMQIIGKWWSRRLVYLYSDYIKVIELYLFLRRKLKINSEYVFVSHSNNSKWKPLSRASVEEIISKAWEKVWITVRPHKLRHTCATQMLENWGDIVYIWQILWHTNLKTTQCYLDYSNDKLKKTQLLIPKL